MQVICQLCARSRQRAPAASRLLRLSGAQPRWTALRQVHEAARPVRILGLESSADDTCAAIVDSTRNVLSNVVIRQDDLLARWGGIHPLHATARHQRNMPKAIRQCLDEARLEVSDVDAIAYTRGPGMPSCLGACALAAKTLSAAYNKPLIGVHHMQAHALTVGLTETTPPGYPFLTLLVSGGHTLLLLAESAFKFKLLATSDDDSIGDAYDKVTRMLDIPWGNARSGGQALEEFVQARPASTLDLAFPIPAPRELIFSYSGLKSAVKREIEKGRDDTERKRSIAGAFQKAAVGQLTSKTALALQQLDGVALTSLVVSGGVASNAYLRQEMRRCLDENGRQDMRLLFPPPALCTDNAVMIAWAAFERYDRGMWDTFDSPLRAKWSLEECERMD